MARIIGNTTATPNPQSDWNQTDDTKADYIKNKPDLTSVGSGSSGIVDLGTFYAVHNNETGEETLTTTSTKYESYNTALDETRTTGVYKIGTDYREDDFHTLESSLLFVSGGIDYQGQEIVHQMLFDNFNYDESPGSIMLPRLRTYYWDGSNYIWSDWTDCYNGFDGFEYAKHKVGAIVESGVYEEQYQYPTTYAVVEYVKDKIDEAKPSDELLSKINNAQPKREGYDLVKLEPNRIDGMDYDYYTIFTNDNDSYGTSYINVYDTHCINKKIAALEARIAELENKLA